MQPTLDDVDVILLDIEGTVCPISFVKDTLFPYALSALPEVLKTRWDDPVFKQYRDAFPAEHTTTPEALEAHVRDLTTRDVKIASLKNLQGYLWEAGYQSKAYSTPLFEDVTPFLQSQHAQGRKLVIYSSGSIFAQKLLFAHVQRSASDSSSQSPAQPESASASASSSRQATGKNTIDLNPLITSYFDTTNAGPKQDPASYSAIVRALTSSSSSNSPDPASTAQSQAQTQRSTASRIVFFSDIPAEIDAALAAGLRTITVRRPGNAPLPSEWINTSPQQQHREVIDSFQDLI